VTTETLTQRLAGGGGPRRRIVAALGAIVVVVIAIGIIVGAGAPASSKGQSSGSTASGATTVQRRDLVETDTESGTLGYANQQTVFNRLSGTITYLPNVGAVIKPGGTLYQVDGYPVILFNGSYPAFRDLTSGDTNGPDIEELNADLKQMGFDPDNAITVDQTWQAATTDAVELFQGKIGQTETGTLSLGQIVFLPGPQLVNAVDTTVGSTGGSSGTGSGASDSSASDTTDPTSTATPASYPIAGQPHAEFVDLTTSSTLTPKRGAASVACPNVPTTTTTTTPSTDCPSISTTGTPTTLTPTTTTTTPTTTTPLTSTSSNGQSSAALQAIVKLLETQNKLLLAELKSAKKSSASAGGSSSGLSSGGGKSGGGGGSVSSSSASSGGGSSGGGSSGSGSSGSSSAGASADPILSTSSTELVVTVDLDATKQSEAKLNEPVTVELPDGTTVNGKITGVSPVATSSSSSSSSSSAGAGASAPSATIPVTVSLEKHADASALDQAAVSVNFEEQVANNVLSVPVTALLATQGGGYAVQEANAPHKLIPVTPGLFAAGYVQISGPDVVDGMQVTDSQG